MRIRDKNHLHNLCLGLVHSLVILIPFGMALFTGAYTIFNKNAYLSYDKQNILKETPVQNDSMLLNNYNYILNIRTFIDNTDTNFTGTSPNLYPKEQIDWTKYQNIQSDILSNVVQFQILRANASYVNIQLKDDTNTQIASISKSVNTWKNYSETDLIIPFTLINSRSFENAKYGTYLQQVTYIQENLDNAFEYGFQKTNDSFEQVNYSILDFDALELFDIDYSNNVYLTFVNYYIKYLLNMELVLFIPEILLIFFTLVRRLMLSIVDKTDERSY